MVESPSIKMCDPNKDAKCVAKITAHETSVASINTMKTILSAIVGAFAIVIALALRDVIEPFITDLGLTGTSATIITILLYFLFAVIISLIVMQLDKVIKSMTTRARNNGIPV